MRGRRLAPRRYEIEPSQIVPYLSETVILEQPGSDGCRIRVAGTKVCEWLGDDLRGQLFFELWSEEDQYILQDNLTTVVMHGAAGLFNFSGQLSDDQPAAEFEMLLLPLTHLEDQVERVLGSISVVRAPDWLDTTVPLRIALTSNEIIWPDGRPFALASHVRRAASENAHTPVFRGLGKGSNPNSGAGGELRRARLVRTSRQNFLVYDGGKLIEEQAVSPRGLKPRER